MAYIDGILFQIKTEGSVLADAAAVTTIVDTVNGFIGTPISPANQASFRTNQINGFGSIAFTDDAYDFNNTVFGSVTMFLIVKSTGVNSGYVFGSTDTDAIIKDFVAGQWEWYNSPRTVLSSITGVWQLVVCNVANFGGVLRLGNQQATSGSFAQFEYAEIAIFPRLTAPQIASKTDDLNLKYFNIAIPATTTEIICGVDSRMRGTDPAGQTTTASTPHQTALILGANSISFDGTFIIPNDAAKTTTVRNRGVNSRTLANFVLNNMAAELTLTATNKRFVNEAGINDVTTGRTAAQIIQSFADVQSYCDANGIIHNPTTIDRVAAVAGNGNTQAQIDAFNIVVDAVNVSHLANYPTTVIQFNRNATLADVTNTAVSPDGFHSAAAAKAVKGRMIADRVNNTIAFPAFTTTTIPNVDQGAAYSQQLVVTNSPTVFTILSGAPTGMVISNLGVLSGNVTGAAGSYSPIIRATKANNDFTDKTYTMNVTAPGTNTGPTVNAGIDQTITLPASANLSGTAADDGFAASVLTTAWSKFSGPGTVTFGNAAALITAAAFSAAGVYVLRLTASDGTLSGTDDVTITVNAAGGGTINKAIRIRHSAILNADGYKIKRATNAAMTLNVVEIDMSNIRESFYDNAVVGQRYYFQAISYRVVGGNATTLGYSSIVFIDYVE